MKKPVRVRFAPSPTGPLHIGGVRTALYNYLFARKHGGTFILRIEDTDQSRYVPDSEKYILEALGWCGLHFDEGPHADGDYGPYRQSERKDIYYKYAEELVKKGHAYYAFDTQASLDIQRASLEAQGKTFSYNWENRDSLNNSLALTEAETRNRLNEGAEYVIRFKSPRDKKIQLSDQVRGTIEIDSNVLDDKVLFKSDGMPTYHLANIVDDHLMKITHVIRGEEWLPSLALHVQLYDAFGWESPEFAHLPLIMKPEGKGKLSKRDGEKLGFPVYPLQWENALGYREEGYFPEAVINFLALLGWNPGTEEEVFNMEALIQAFSLDRVHKSGARFDPDKTKWYNHQYLQMKAPSELAKLFLPILDRQLGNWAAKYGKAIPEYPISYVEKTIALLKERATFINDFWESGSYFYIPPTEFNPKAVAKHWKADTPAYLSDILKLLQDTSNYSSAALEESIKSWISSRQIPFGKIMAPLRLAMVGDLMGPHLFDIIEMIGKEGTIERLRHAIDSLEAR